MIIAVDFDGTIVEHAYPQIGRAVPFAIDVLRRLQEEGHHQLILWTVREGELLQAAIDYCKDKGLEFYAINSNYPELQIDSNGPRKIIADCYIDDRNIGGLPEWGIIYRMIMHNESYADAMMLNDLKAPKRSFFSRLKK